MPLSDQDRTKLDGIVSKMQAGGEKDEYIQSVVNDFKSKYAKSDNTAAGGFAESFHPVDSTVNAIKAVGNAVLHPIDTATAVVQDLKDRANPDSPQNQAGSNFLEEHKDDSFAKMAGRKVGELASDAVQMAATEGAGRVLGKVARVVPGANKIQAVASEEAALDKSGVKPAASEMWQGIEDLKKQNMTSGGTVLDDTRHKALSDIQSKIVDEAQSGKQSFSGWSDIKTSLQKEAAKSNGFAAMIASPEVKTSTKAYVDASRVVRSVIRDTPGAEAWSKLEDQLATAHKISSAVGKATVGAAGLAGVAATGPLVGTALEIAAGAKGAGLINKLGEQAAFWVTSGRASQASAPIRNAFADALAAGRWKMAASIAAADAATQK